MVQPIPEGFTSLTPHITVKDARKAIETYKKAFGAEVLMVHEMGGMVGHATLRIGDTMLMLNDEYPEQGCTAPDPARRSVALHLYVKNADAAFAKATKAGCKVLMPLTDMFWGDRYGMVQDPYGHNWSIATHVEDVSPEDLAARAEKMMAEGGCGEGAAH